MNTAVPIYADSATQMTQYSNDNYDTTTFHLSADLIFIEPVSFNCSFKQSVEAVCKEFHSWATVKDQWFLWLFFLNHRNCLQMCSFVLCVCGFSWRLFPIIFNRHLVCLFYCRSAYFFAKVGAFQSLNSHRNICVHCFVTYVDLFDFVSIFSGSMI